MTSQTYVLNKVSKPRVLEKLSQLSLEKPWSITVKPYRKNRTSDQNARLWKLHTLASQATGYTPDELHELMLRKFFGTKEIDVAGLTMTVPLKRSSGRDTKEFGQFMEMVETFYVSELGVWLG